MQADTLLVFGRGVTAVDGGWCLTAESLARVEAALAYADGCVSRIVFTGGWAPAVGLSGPPVGHREGDLMLAAARAAGVSLEVDLHVESRSRSTLENVLHTVEDRLLGDGAFTPARPLGIVSHRWHLPRIRYLLGKVLRLRGRALLDVPVTGGPSPWSERMLAVGSRLCFLGSADPVALRRREELVTRLGRRR
jgi:hypothetical protein